MKVGQLMSLSKGMRLIEIYKISWDNNDIGHDETLWEGDSIDLPGRFYNEKVWAFSVTNTEEDAVRNKRPGKGVFDNNKIHIEIERTSPKHDE